MFFLGKAQGNIFFSRNIFLVLLKLGQGEFQRQWCRLHREWSLFGLLQAKHRARCGEMDVQVCTCKGAYKCSALWEEDSFVETAHAFPTLSELQELIKLHFHWHHCQRASSFLTVSHVIGVCLSMHTHIWCHGCCPCDNQRQCFSPSTFMRVLGIELRLPGLLGKQSRARSPAWRKRGDF